MFRKICLKEWSVGRAAGWNSALQGLVNAHLHQSVPTNPLMSIHSTNHRSFLKRLIMALTIKWSGFALTHHFKGFFLPLVTWLHASGFVVKSFTAEKRKEPRTRHTFQRHTPSGLLKGGPSPSYSLSYEFLQGLSHWSSYNLHYPITLKSTSSWPTHH